MIGMPQLVNGFSPVFHVLILCEPNTPGIGKKIGIERPYEAHGVMLQVEYDTLKMLSYIYFIAIPREGIFKQKSTLI